jgi:hypothetical protein
MMKASRSSMHPHPSPPSRRAYSLVLASITLFAAGLSIAAARPMKPKGELVLDAASPIVDVVLAGVRLRLRVDPSQWGAIELNPVAAARLPVTFEDGNAAMVGRTLLTGRAAHAMLQIGHITLPVAIAEHGRPVTRDADGVIGPEMLPFAYVRWQRADAPLAIARRTFLLDFDEDTGLGAIDPSIPGELRIHASFILPTSFATAAAGAELARDHRGRFDTPAAPIAAPFGLTRPARSLVFADPVKLAGFRFDRILVRIADFRGNRALPSDAVTVSAGGGDIVVARRERPQQAEPWVTIAADRLIGCAEVTYSAMPRTLTLACAFDGVQ